MTHHRSRGGHRAQTSALAGATVLAVLASVSAAPASDRWTEAGSGAVAILPVPVSAEGIIGASLACSEQRWTLRLRLDALRGGPAARQFRLTAGTETFDVAATGLRGVAEVALSDDALDAFKSGSRLSIDSAPEGPALKARFSLRDSRRTLDALAPRCSQIDMSPYRAVPLSATDPAASDAAELLKDEVRLFREATTATPEVKAGMVPLAEGRALLFASVCGSSWYYGRTGCTLAGFRRVGAGGAWEPIYSSEGMSLYVDPESASGGWPDLVTLSGGRDRIHWRWGSTEYELRDPELAVDGPLATPTAQ